MLLLVHKQILLFFTAPFCGCVRVAAGAPSPAVAGGAGQPLGARLPASPHAFRMDLWGAQPRRPAGQFRRHGTLRAAPCSRGCGT